MPGLPEKCPNCGMIFSDWFVWEGLSYCYPCQVEAGLSIRNKPLYTEQFNTTTLRVKEKRF